tara:strand:- start:160 stop:366 length:207 start_codon:yes stop_codon:yes gene_type:complete
MPYGILSIVVYPPASCSVQKKILVWIHTITVLISFLSFLPWAMGILYAIYSMVKVRGGKKKKKKQWDP